MKKLFFTLAAAFLLASCSQADVIDDATETTSGPGDETWTVTETGNTAKSEGSDGLILSGGNNSSVTDPKFTIVNHLKPTSVVISNEAPAADEMANAGTWTLTDGLAADAAGADVNFTLNGNSFTLDLLEGGGTHNSSQITANDDWDHLISQVSRKLRTQQLPAPFSKGFDPKQEK